jgi:hypothetical protein
LADGHLTHRSVRRLPVGGNDDAIGAKYAHEQRHDDYPVKTLYALNLGYFS